MNPTAEHETTWPSSVSWLELLLVCVVAVVYLATASPWVLGGDNGEFSAIGAMGGVAHPPGYPLYTLYLRLTSWLPGVSPAHTAALATALLGAASVWGVCRAAMAWGASLLAAVVAAGVYGFSSLAWVLGTHAEVFVLNGMLVSAIVMLAAPLGPLRGMPRVLTLGALAGLALANHHSAVLVLPLGLYGVARGVWESQAWWSTLAAAGLFLVALGLPYGYTFWVGHHVEEVAWVWGDVSHLSGLVHHILRGDYGTTRLAISQATPEPLAHIGALLVHLGRDLWGVAALLGGVGLVWAVWGGASRWGGLALVATWLLAGPVFVSQFNLELEGIARLIVQRFYLLPQMLLTVGAALGLDQLGALVGARTDDDGTPLLEPHAPGRREGLVVGLVLALGVWIGHGHVAEHHRPDVEHYLVDSLRPLPKGAVLLGTGDHRTFGFVYMRTAVGLRPDVVFIDPMLMHYPWYTRRISAQVGRPLTGAVEGNVDSRRLAVELLETGRPVFMTNLFSQAIVTSLPTYPYGLTLQVLPPGSLPPEPNAVMALNIQLYDAMLLDPEQSALPGTWAAEVRAIYARTWHGLAEALNRLGAVQQAHMCSKRAQRYTAAP